MAERLLKAGHEGQVVRDQQERRALGVTQLAEKLSRRELQVLEGLTQGKSNKEIARDLDVTEPTVKLHVKTLCRKLDAKNRTQAAMIARDTARCNRPYRRRGIVTTGDGTH